MTWQRRDYISQPPAVKLISFCENDYERLCHKGEEGKNISVPTIREIEKLISKQLWGEAKWFTIKWPLLDKRLVAVGNRTATPGRSASVNVGPDGGGKNLHAIFRDHSWRGRHAVSSTVAVLLFSSADVLAENCCISKFLIYEWFSALPPVES